MNSRNHFAARLLAGASLGLIAALMASAALAADADAGGSPSTTGTGAEGTEVSGVIVKAEINRAAATAPAKASLEQTQPEAIISHGFIEQVTPETGGWIDIVQIAPSMSGISSNGGGVGEYSKVTMRGFQDGQFNVTYDGISFGDTNDPTHHEASYWPASTIGAAVVDRGPGAAGDLGQSNYGGAIHFFSPEVSDQFGIVQKVTYGSFDTVAAVTTLNTGSVREFGGGKLLLNFDERWSAGELSNSGGKAFNQLGKFILPLGDKWTLTAFASVNWTRFSQSDAGPGETWQQVELYGKNFALNNNPLDEHDQAYNYEHKSTDFEYMDLKGALTDAIAVEDQAYTYFYQNKTVSANDITGIIGGPNTDSPSITKAPQSASDIGGYFKLNQYRVWGDVIRFSEDWSFGNLKFGGIAETAATGRDNLLEDLTLGIPDLKFTPAKYPALTTATNAKLLEISSWLQGQFFVDFNWTPLPGLRISPGFKYVDFTRNVDASNESVGGGTKNQPLKASNNYQSPLYFLTVNYKIMPDLAVYGQFATSFLIPSLSTLYVTDVNEQSLQPATAQTYQAGAVYTHGPITADADVYLIDTANLELACELPGTAANSAFCNVGKARYDGVEGEAAYALPWGVTLFANGSLNNATQLANSGANGTPVNPERQLASAPKWTDALGAIINHGPWQGSLTFKQSGSFVEYGAVQLRLPGYSTLDASAAYDFGHVKLKLQVFNIADNRAINTYTPSATATSLYALDGSLYQFQAGREVSFTVIGKF